MTLLRDLTTATNTVFTSTLVETYLLSASRLQDKTRKISLLLFHSNADMSNCKVPTFFKCRFQRKTVSADYSATACPCASISGSVGHVLVADMPLARSKPPTTRKQTTVVQSEAVTHLSSRPLRRRNEHRVFYALSLLPRMTLASCVIVPPGSNVFVLSGVEQQR